MPKKRSLLDAYRFPGFRPRARIKGIFGDPQARVIRLERRQKNGVRLVWHLAREFLRPQGPSYPGSVLWGHAYSPGSGGPPSLVSVVRQGEVGDVAVAGGQSVLHEALCLVCGTALPGNNGQGGGEGTQVGLEDREESGQGV
ncbi:MAG: hypothetical protein OEY91_00145 [Nitrospirota bacterium]|nr:hypothetical protein [Nitrospirota bacterium]